MGATDRGAELRERAVKLLAKRTLGEMYGVDLGPALLPGPQGVTGGYLMTVSARSPVLSPPRMAHTTVIRDPWPDDTTLESAIGECLTGLAAVRRQLAGVPAERKP